jgi:hypothetical protein
MEQIQSVGQKLRDKNYVFLPSETVRKLLDAIAGGTSAGGGTTQSNVGDNDDDDDTSTIHSAPLSIIHNDRNEMKSLAQFWDQTAPQRDEHGNEVYPGKRSLCGYYHTVTDRRIVTAVEPGGTNQHHHHNNHITIEHIDPTTVHQVSNYRVHKAWPTESDTHSTLVALRKIMLEIVQQIIVVDVGDDEIPIDNDGMGDSSNNNRNNSISSNETNIHCLESMQTAYRVIKSGPTLPGDPGPEGVHQDAALLTAIVLIGRHNVHNGSGRNRIWSLAQPNGKPKVVVQHHDNLIAEMTLQNPLDTLLVLDRKVKHEATVITPIEESLPAIRDVLTFEVRPHQNEVR